MILNARASSTNCSTKTCDLNESFGGVLKEKAPKSFDLRAFEAILLCFCTQSGNRTRTPFTGTGF